MKVETTFFQAVFMLCFILLPYKLVLVTFLYFSDILLIYRLRIYLPPKIFFPCWMIWSRIGVVFVDVALERWSTLLWWLIVILTTSLAIVQKRFRLVANFWVCLFSLKSFYIPLWSVFRSWSSVAVCFRLSP